MQGKENDIVFVSTVRSGDGSPRFIDDKRRVNVSLSRAKHSFLVVGDTQLLQSKCVVWKSVLDKYRETETIKYP